ncbi:hypothetical protein [Streptomyces sp. NPDC090021]|uniref:hypothetical protein n=1 Tax=Streptomyces sp. NPDC090021 TaxID=3365919 RepID=UPI0037FECE41
MTSTRRTDHDRVRHQPDDPDRRWPLRGDLAYDIANFRTGVVMGTPEDTGITFYRLTPEGGGHDGWNATLDTLVPPEDVPAALPRRAPGAAVQPQPECAPWDDPFGDSPDPSPFLRTHADRGMDRFMQSAGADGSA